MEVTVRTIVCVDWDHTLMTFEHDAGIRAMRKALHEFVQEKDATVLSHWANWTFYRSLEAGHHNKPWPYEKDIAPEIASVLKAGGGRSLMWSRELWLVAAARIAGIPLPKAGAFKATQAYWAAVAQSARAYPEAPRFMRALKNMGMTVVIVTASDARLILANNDIVIYDDKVSANKKCARIAVSPLHPKIDRIFCADPYDKTNPDFWQHIVAEMGGRAENEFVMVGDSYGSDIIPAKKAGFRTVLVDRESRYSKAACIDADCFVQDLADSLSFIAKKE